MNYRDVVKIKREQAGEPIEEIGEYQMVKQFGLGFYDLDERTAAIFCLIFSIENLNAERKQPAGGK